MHHPVQPPCVRSSSAGGRQLALRTRAPRQWCRGPWPNSVGMFVPRRIFEMAATEQQLESLEVECAMVEVRGKAWVCDI